MQTLQKFKFDQPFKIIEKINITVLFSFLSLVFPK